MSTFDVNGNTSSFDQKNLGKTNWSQAWAAIGSYFWNAKEKSEIRTGKRKA